MVVEEIVTSLKNAIEHGDSLESAIQLAINSGYSESDVRDASQYVGGGVVTNFKPKPNEQLVMPAQKKITGSPLTKPLQDPKTQIKPLPKDNPLMQLTQPITESRNNLRQDNQAIKQNISYGSVYSREEVQNPRSLYNELGQIKPKKENYIKEVLLFFVLIMLVMVLAGTFIFKEDILNFLSSMLS